MKFMVLWKIIISIVCMVFAFVIQICLVPNLGITGICPNLMLAALIVLSCVFDSNFGLVTGIITGIIADVLLSERIGVYTVSFACIGWITPWIQSRFLFPNKYLRMGLYGTFLYLIIQVIMLLVLYLSLQAISITWVQTLRQFISAILTGGFTALFYWISILLSDQEFGHKKKGGAVLEWRSSRY